MPHTNLEFLTAIPKTDLHVHLDGSMRLETLIELADEAGVPLPADTPAGLLETVFREQYKDLADYLAGFGLTVPCLQTPEALERVSRELVEDNLAEGVRYLEVRFAPQLHAGDRMSIAEVMKAVNRGLRQAADRFNASEAVRSGEEVPFQYGIITCALRMFQPEFSQYYQEFTRIHAFSSPQELYEMASLQMARAAVCCRDKLGLPVVGFDLAGYEYGYPAEDHARAYRYAHKHFMSKTVHAGEAFGAQSIFQAITDLYTDRIGHGLLLFDHDELEKAGVNDPERYIDDLVSFIANRRTTIEVCLTSNLQTMPSLGNLSNHPLRRMMQEKLSVTLCTDNRLVSRTTMTDEVRRAVETFDLDAGTLRNIVIYGFKRSFFPGPYKQKRRYVRKAIERYDRLQEDFGVFP